ncbi:MAG: STAS domain-containing protein [Acidimicrobiales bacterium]
MSMSLCSSSLLCTRMAAGVLIVDGEVDIATRDQLGAALTAVTEHADATMAAGEVHLDVAGLRFIDVGGVRVLVTAAARRPPGRGLVLHHPAATLVRILELSWRHAPGLRLEHDPAAGASLLTTTSADERRVPDGHLISAGSSSGRQRVVTP